jgi:hypothetical protein
MQRQLSAAIKSSASSTPQVNGQSNQCAAADRAAEVSHGLVMILAVADVERQRPDDDAGGLRARWRGTLSQPLADDRAIRCLVPTIAAASGCAERRMKPAHVRMAARNAAMRSGAERRA